VRWEIKLSLDDKLSQEYSYQKLLKSDNPSSRYSRKCRGCFFGTQCIVHGLTILDFSQFFTLSNSITRGHEPKLVKTHRRINCRAHFFANRCIDVLNSLKSDTVLACSVASFKCRLNAYDFSKYLRIV